MLVTDELLGRTKMCSLEPTDFLEALVRLADALQGDTDPPPFTCGEAFEVCTWST